MAEGRSKFRERLSLVADIWSLIPETIRSWIPSAVGGVVIWVLNRLGVPPLEAVGIGVGIAILLVLPLVLRYLSPPSASQSAPAGGGTLLRGRASALKLGASQIVGLLLVALFAHSLYLQSQLRWISKAMDCYVLPRHLTSEQQNAIAAYLKKYNSSDITVLSPADDIEAFFYAQDFRQAFAQGDWRPAREVTPPLREGSFPDRGTSLRHTSNSNTKKGYDEGRQRAPHPGTIALQALKGFVDAYNGIEEDSTLEDGVHKVELTIRSRSDSLCE